MRTPRFLPIATALLLAACSSPYVPDAGGDGGDASCDGRCADAGRRDATLGDARRDAQAMDGSVCPIAYADCDGDESNGCETMLGNTTNCGRCDDKCRSSEVCLATGPGTFACSAPNQCPAPTVLCGPVCVNVTTDPQHCGNCTTVCPPPDGGRASCVNSRCVTM